MPRLAVLLKIANRQTNRETPDKTSSLVQVIRTQLLLRWPRCVAQVKFLLSNVELTHCFSLISENREK